MCVFSEIPPLRSPQGFKMVLEAFPTVLEGDPNSDTCALILCLSLYVKMGHWSLVKPEDWYHSCEDDCSSVFLTACTAFTGNIHCLRLAASIQPAGWALGHKHDALPRAGAAHQALKKLRWILGLDGEAVPSYWNCPGSTVLLSALWHAQHLERRVSVLLGEIILKCLYRFTKHSQIQCGWELAGSTEPIDFRWQS